MLLTVRGICRLFTIGQHFRRFAYLNKICLFAALIHPPKPSYIHIDMGMHAAEAQAAATTSNHYSTILCPPECVQHMRELSDANKLQFSKEVTVPALVIPSNLISRIAGCKVIADGTLRRFGSRIKPIVDGPTAASKSLLFDPALFEDAKRCEEILSSVKQLTDLTVEFEKRTIRLEYQDWTAKQCISAILPDGLLFGGFSQVGHIVHVNLREELLPYKLAIGQILLDKTNNCRTVVNKLESIANEYRVFDLDLLAGEPNYVTELREGGLRYKLDFSKVFWNSRLSSEHERLARRFNRRTAVFDCCAGIGPFVLPAAMRGSRLVMANDLNPESVKWLKQNIEINAAKLGGSNIEVYCMDAVEFIRSKIAEKLVTESHNLYNEPPSEAPPDTNDSNSTQKILATKNAQIQEAHILMNLPATSLSFLPTFRGLLSNRIANGEFPFTVIVHCHLFVKAHADEEDEWYAEEAKKLVAQHLGYGKIQFKEVHFVRKVAGRKQMYCVTVELPNEVLFAEIGSSNTDEKGTGVETTKETPQDSIMTNDPVCKDDEPNGNPLEPPQKMAKFEDSDKAI